MKNIKLILIVFVLLISNTYAQYVQTNEGMYIVNNGIVTWPEGQCHGADKDFIQ